MRRSSLEVLDSSLEHFARPWHVQVFNRHSASRPFSRANASSSAALPDMIVRACSVTSSNGQSHHAARSRAATSSSGNRIRSTRAGLPPTTAYGGTSPTTTEHAATIAPWPTVTPGITTDRYPSHTSLPTTVSPRESYARTRSPVLSAHSPPKIPNGKVDGPSVGWLPAAIRNR